MVQNWIAILCMVFGISEFIFLVTLSGVLLTFSIFLNLLLIALTMANPLFLAIIRQLGKIIIYLMHLTVIYARNILLTVKCSQLESPLPPDILQEQIIAVET